MKVCLESMYHKNWSVSCLTWNLFFAMGLINFLSLIAGNVNSHINVVY